MFNSCMLLWYKSLGNCFSVKATHSSKSYTKSSTKSNAPLTHSFKCFLTWTSILLTYIALQITLLFIRMDMLRKKKTVKGTGNNDKNHTQIFQRVFIRKTASKL